MSSKEVLVLEDGVSRWERFSDFGTALLRNTGVIERILGADPAALRVFLLTATPKGRSYRELINEFEDDEIRDLERSLDKLLDAGLLTPGWKLTDGIYERRFRNRGEISKSFTSFQRYATKNAFKEKNKRELINKYWIKLPERFSRLSAFQRQVSDRIINYFAHIGDILDPDHLIINGFFKKPITYEDIWKAITEMKDENITGSGFYESDIKYYHPDKKKMAIYNLPCSHWVGTNVGIEDSEFQCKVRFIFYFDKSAKAYKFQIIPIINPRIQIRQECNPQECPYGFKFKFCSLKYNKNFSYKEIYNNTNEDYICIDCVLFNAIYRIASKFMNEYFFSNSIINKHEATIIKDDCTWEYLSNKYKDKNAGGINEFINELVDAVSGVHGVESENVQMPEIDEIPQPPEFIRTEIRDIESQIKEVMLKVGEYGKENGYETLVLLLRKGYAFVKHEIHIDNEKKTVEAILKDDYEFKRIISDKEFEFELLRANTDKTLEELKKEKIIIFDDAINDGNHIKVFLNNIKKLVGKEYIRDNVKVGAYIANKHKLEKLKEDLRSAYGNGLIEDKIILVRV